MYPGDPEPRIFKATTIASEGYNLSHVHLGSQTGTHVDAPFHFRQEGATLDQLPLELLVAPALVVSLPGKAPVEPIRTTEVEPYLDLLKPEIIPLFATGWYKYAGTKRFFEHPYLEEALAREMLARGVRTIAIDTLNADYTGGDHFPVHDLFADAGGLIAENLAGTDELDPSASHLLVLAPLNLLGTDGAPTRAFALAI